MTNLSRRRKTMMKTLWKIFKVTTFIFGLLFYASGISLIYEEFFKKPEPIVRPIMYMNRNRK